VQIEPTALPDVLILIPARFGDARGWFSETWNGPKLAALIVTLDFVQDNRLMSAAPGTLRGLHFGIADALSCRGTPDGKRSSGRRTSFDGTPDTSWTDFVQAVMVGASLSAVMHRLSAA